MFLQHALVFMYFDKYSLIIHDINLRAPISISPYYPQNYKSNSTLFVLHQAIENENISNCCHVITRLSLSILNNAVSICIIVVF